MLDWPAGWPRTPADQRKWGNFNRRGTKNQYGYTPMRRVTIAEAWRDVTNEVTRLGGQDLRVDVDQAMNRDGSPRSGARAGEDPGAIVHFRLEGRPLVIACDRFQHAESNLRAIAILLEAKRTLARYGFLDMTREFEGYAALPAGRVARPPHEVLGVAHDAPPEVVTAAYKALVLKHHPDRGGDAEAFREITEAHSAMTKVIA